MRVTILTLGSRGDVQPFLAFGNGLQRAGHRVRLATYPRLEEMVRKGGLEFAPLTEGALSLGRQTAEGRRWVESGHRRMPTWVGFVRDARSVAHRRLADAAAASADADVVVASNLAQLLGWQVAEDRRVPLVRTLFHAPTYWMTRSATLPAAFGRQAAWCAAKPWLDRVRREALNLPPVPLREPIGGLDERGAPVVYPFSPAVFPRPERRNANVAVTGYWFFDGMLDPEAPAQVVEFLAAGAPPVCIGFGTQIDDDPAGTTRMMVEALRGADQRGILVRSHEALAGATLPADVIAVEAISHHWLLPRCCAAVHHAASGTTAACLRAGVPGVPVPHNSDQFSWARRVHELGVASHPIPRRKLSVQRLEAAIRMVTSDGEMRRRAAALGARIRAEDGVARGVEFFEAHVGGAVARPLLAAAVASDRGVMSSSGPRRAS